LFHSPLISELSREVLTALGYDADPIDALGSSGAVGLA
jgi:hypothetical protein